MGMLETHYRLPLTPMAEDTRAALVAAMKGAGLVA